MFPNKKSLTYKRTRRFWVFGNTENEIQLCSCSNRCVCGVVGPTLWIYPWCYVCCDIFLLRAETRKIINHEKKGCIMPFVAHLLATWIVLKQTPLPSWGTLLSWFQERNWMNVAKSPSLFSVKYNVEGLRRTTERLAPVELHGYWKYVCEWKLTKQKKTFFLSNALLLGCLQFPSCNVQASQCSNHQ